MEFKTLTVKYFRELEKLYQFREHADTEISTAYLNKQIRYLEQSIQEHCFEKYDIPWFRLWTVWKTRDVVTQQDEALTSVI